MHGPAAAQTARSELVDGELTDAYPQVVGIVARQAKCEPEVAQLYCTGTLIAPRVVLTAAHCFDISPSGTAYEVVAGEDALDPNAGRRAFSIESHAHPDFNPQTHDDDIGVLILAEPLDITPLPLLRAEDELSEGMEATVLGYGKTRNDEEPEGLKRIGLTRVSEVSDASFRTEPDPSMTCTGDSGGPVIVQGPDGPALAGVTASGDFACEDYAKNTRASSYWGDWVKPLVERAAQLPVSRPEEPLSPLSLCNVGCSESADCPAAMNCSSSDSSPGAPGSAGRCQLPRTSPGWFGDRCSTDATCGSAGDCRRLWPSGPDACRCFNPCDTMAGPVGEAGDAGDSDAESTDATEDGERADADPSPRLSGGGGCSSVTEPPTDSPNSRVWLMMLLSAVLLASHGLQRHRHEPRL
ncbi:MAG: S1 family peptidase [Myxococcota bacterium]